MSLRIHQMTESEYAEAASGTRTDGGFGALDTASGNLPLESLDLAVLTTGLAGEVELAQGFRNPYPEPLEATYIFPLPDRAAVTAMRMEADDRTVEGILKERGEARAEYDRAVSEGRRAAITEEERPDVFTMRVGNVMPGEQVTVRLRLALELGYEDGVATLRFPLVVAPRYIPGEPLDSGSVGVGVALDTDAVPDASRITPPVLLPGCPNPIRLSISADVEPAGLPLAEVSSSLHPIQVEEAPYGRTTVTVHPGERADRDFVLCLRLARMDTVTTSLVVMPDDADGEGTFALTLLPPSAPAHAASRDVVLVLDRSGSMAGWKIVAARRAAARIIDTLTKRDRFAVLAFDNVIETPAGLPDGLVEATDRHRYRAVEHLARMEARGGTEMLVPLRRAAGLIPQATGDARERTIVLVTDGQVGNEDQILRELASQVRDVRIHTVGVDVAVNAGFLHRLADVSGGRCELVESEDRLDEVMEAIHRRIGTPLVTDLELVPDGLAVIDGSVTPARLPAIYEGVPLVVRGRCATPASRGGMVARGRAADGGEWAQHVSASAGHNSALAAVWARAHIRDLEDRHVTASLSDRSMIEQLERDIVATSLRFGVLSRFTAYVAVDTRVVREGDTVRHVTQPVEMPQGWEMPTIGAPTSRGYPLMAAPAAGVRLGFAGRVEAAASEALTTAMSDASAPLERGIGAPGPIHETWQALSEWAARLRQARSADRERLLGELRDQLPALIDALERSSAEHVVVRPLRELLDALRAPFPIGAPHGVELEARWARARAALDVFEQRNGLAGPSTEQRAQPRRVAFWRR